jgi:uncharacterized membrane protein YphA (DoxX/SURF4 family)
MAAVTAVRHTEATRHDLAIAVLRGLFGLVFLANGAAKLLPGSWMTPFGYLIGGENALATLRAALASHPVGPYRSFMESFVDSWPSVVLALAGFELVVGLLLIVGLAARWAALAAGLYALQLHWLTLFSGGWLFTYPLLWLPLFVLAVLDAGRAYGLDGRRRRSVTAARDDGG